MSVISGVIISIDRLIFGIDLIEVLFFKIHHENIKQCFLNIGTIKGKKSQVRDILTRALKGNNQILNPTQAHSLLSL